MMNIDQMAHEHAIEFLKAAFEEDKDCSINYQLLAEESYLYADAMQAEADKRNYSEKQDSSEWQPYWSDAPDAKYWAIDSSGFADWFLDKPELDKESFVGNRLHSALQYGYQGDWKNSLRKRP